MRVGIVLAAALLLASAAHADVAARYAVDQKALKATLSTDMLAFAVYEDAACAELLFDVALSAGDAAITYEQPKLKKIKGGPKPTKTTIIATVLSPPAFSGPLFLRVTGPGVISVGSDCQVQEGAAPAPPPLSNYADGGSLNTASITATDVFAQVGPSLPFTKEHDDTRIEVVLNSRVGGGTFAGGASGVRFELRVDGVPGSVGNDGSVRVSNAEEFLSIFSLFEGLGAGSHSASVWTRTNGGTSAGVVLDPAGWGGAIIVKETR